MPISWENRISLSFSLAAQYLEGPFLETVHKEPKRDRCSGLKSPVNKDAALSDVLDAGLVCSDKNPEGF